MIIGTATNRTKQIVCILVNERRYKHAAARITVNINASLRDRSPLANGLFLVLSTFLSYWRSIMSFIAQPTDLVKKEPSTTIVK